MDNKWNSLPFPGFLCSSLHEPQLCAHICSKQPWAIAVSLCHLPPYLYWTLQFSGWTVLKKMFYYQLYKFFPWSCNVYTIRKSYVLLTCSWKSCYVYFETSWYCPLMVYYCLDYKFDLLGVLQLRPWSYWYTPLIQVKSLSNNASSK